MILKYVNITYMSMGQKTDKIRQKDEDGECELSFFGILYISEIQYHK